MNIELNTTILDEYKLTPDHWVFMYLQHKEMHDLAWSLAELRYEDLEYLQAQGWLKIAQQGTTSSDYRVVIRQQFIDLVERNDDEIVGLFCSTYPKSEHRAGVKVNLQKDKKRIESKIKALVGNDRVKANAIIECIKFDLDKRKRSPTASWLPDLLVYLNQERWRFVEDDLNRLHREQQGEIQEEDGRVTREL